MRSTFFLAIFALLTVCQTAIDAQVADERVPARRVSGHTVISEGLPKMKIKIDSKFRYLGRIQITAMGGKSEAEQFIFGEIKNGQLGRTVIAHFERFLPTNDSQFIYPRLKMVTLVGDEYLNQSWAIKDTPLFQRPELKALLQEKGIRAEADWIMNRYVRAVDAEMKHEIILFYLEPGSLVSVPVGDLAPGGRSTDQWPKIEQAVIERSLKAFKIVK